MECDDDNCFILYNVLSALPLIKQENTDKLFEIMIYDIGKLAKLVVHNMLSRNCEYKSVLGCALHFVEFMHFHTPFKYNEKSAVGMFATAVLVAAKLIEDEFPSNDAFAYLLNISNSKMNKMEATMFMSLLDDDGIVVTPIKLRKILDRIETLHLQP
jgi:hypothetical protein